MDVKIINPFLSSFNTVMPQLGFGVNRKNIELKDHIKGSGVSVTVGITGDIKGNVIYIMDEDGGKSIASQMMMGMEVTNFDDMAQSAISELTNMLTANAGINYSQEGVNIDISTPVLVTGKEVSINVNTEKIICIEMEANDTTIEINIAIEN